MNHKKLSFVGGGNCFCVFEKPFLRLIPIVCNWPFKFHLQMRNLIMASLFPTRCHRTWTKRKLSSPSKVRWPLYENFRDISTTACTVSSPQFSNFSEDADINVEGYATSFSSVSVLHLVFHGYNYQLIVLWVSPFGYVPALF